MKKKKEKSRRGLAIVLLIGMLIPIIISVFMGVSGVLAADDYKYIRNLQPNIGGDEVVTPASIDKYIEQKGWTSSPMYGRGSVIIEKADEYGINRAFMVGVMSAETSMGTAGVGKTSNNYGGIRNATFDTMEEGVESVAKIHARYMNGEVGNLEKNSTFGEMLKVYSPTSDDNSHNSIFQNHLEAYEGLGIDPGEMQATGELKDGTAANSIDYTPSGSGGNDLKALNNLAEYCPINCDLVSEQEVTETSNGADVGNLKVLEMGKTWEGDDLLETDLGYTSDKVTEENLQVFLQDSVGVGNSEELAKHFYQAGHSSGLDPRFLVSHWAVETDKGKSEAWTSSNNAFGWTTGSDFETEREGIIEGSKLIAVNYYNEGQKNINSMVKDDHEHIVSADGDWGKSIAAIMKKSEDHMGESEGKLDKNVQVKSEYEAIYEQCFGEGTKRVSSGGYGGDYVEQVIQHLQTEGYTPEAIAGILGNMHKESGVRPFMLQGYSGHVEEVKNMTDAERDQALAEHRRGAYGAGLVQWETRFSRVRAVAAEMGVSPWTVDPQMKVVIEEIKEITAGNYHSGKLHDMFLVTTDVHAATSAFAQHFERCRACKPGTGEFEGRTVKSKEYYNQYLK